MCLTANGAPSVVSGDPGQGDGRGGRLGNGEARLVGRHCGEKQRKKNPTCFFTSGSNKVQGREAKVRVVFLRAAYLD